MSKLKRALVIGAGYIGFPLACRLRDLGYDVTGWVASEASVVALRNVGLSIICDDVANESSWEEARRMEKEKGEWNIIYYAVSTSRGGLEAYERVHHKGLSYALELSCERFIYTSSTSVYGQNSGEWVNEDTPVHPLSPASRILAQAEEEVLAKKGIVARLSAIYGPERGFLFQQWMRGEAVIHGDGSRWLNQIHRDDIITALIHLLTLHLEERQGELFNVTDNEPVQLIHFYQWLSNTFSRPMPPFASDQSLKNCASKRALTNKRVSNIRLRAAGWRPIYPTFKEGYRSLSESLKSIL